MDDVKDLFPRRLPAADPTLSADGLEGFFAGRPDASLAVDSAAELFDTPAVETPESAPALAATSGSTPDLPEDLMGEVEEFFDPPNAIPLELDTAVPAPADPNEPVGELVASLAEELRQLEIALRETDDDSDA